MGWWIRKYLENSVVLKKYLTWSCCLFWIKQLDMCMHFVTWSNSTLSQQLCQGWCLFWEVLPNVVGCAEERALEGQVGEREGRRLFHKSYWHIWIRWQLAGWQTDICCSHTLPQGLVLGQGLSQDFKNTCPKQQFQNFGLSRFIATNLL